MIDYILIGLVLTFLIEISAMYYANKIMIIKDNEPFIQFSILERLFIIMIWPAVVLIFLSVIFKNKEDE
tara:strand:- start:788 stop:994 length:207 start_codon:yes stop_codon:yes gene_type:complete